MTRNAPLTDEMLRRLDGLERARQRREQQLVPEREMQANRLVSLAAWSHKNDGTPETHAHASRTRQGPLARLHLSGAISADQLAWATEIAMAAESIERDVEVRIVSYEPRIDNSASARNVLVERSILRVRREVAYTIWRDWLPHPKRLVLDMIVGDPLSFSTAAKRYGIHKRKTRKLLIDAIDRWPDAMEVAEDQVDDATLAAARAGLL